MSTPDLCAPVLKGDYNADCLAEVKRGRVQTCVSAMIAGARCPCPCMPGNGF